MAKKVSNMRNSIKNAIEEINLIDPQEREEVYRRLNGNGTGSIGRHEFKRLTGGAGGFIFSISTMKQTLDNAQRMGAWIKENYGINRLNRIEEHHIISFLDHQKQKGNSPKTLDSYKHAIMKLSKGTEARFGYSILTDSIKNYDIGGSVNAVRDRIWTDSQVEQIADSIRGKYRVDVQIMLKVGLRVHELYQLKGENITLESSETVFTRKDGEIPLANTIKVTGKGGKVSYRPILPEHISFFRELKESHRDNERITNSPRDRKKARNAIGSAIRRTSKKLFGIDKARCHEFRKTFANKLWSDMREQGFSKEERIAYVLGRGLSHGHSRNELVFNYITAGNQH